jgi:hypothetical protein
MLELILEMKRDGWVQLKGQRTLGFVSPCGEKFNCYDYETGEFYSFGTIWAVRATQGDRDDD